MSLRDPIDWVLSGRMGDNRVRNLPFYKNTIMEQFFSQKGSVNWLTPPEVINAARKTFGGAIDLDPCPSTNPKNWFATKNWSLGGPVDSLRVSWSDGYLLTTSLINPPFGTSYVNGSNCISSKEYSELQNKSDLQWQKQTILMWAQKVVEESHKGNEIIWISKAAIESKAIQLVLENSSAACFPTGRIGYVDPITLVQEDQPTFPSIILYLGENQIAESFIKHFSSIGICRKLEL